MATQKFQLADVDGFVEDIVSISDTLSNLAYLIDVDAENPVLVRQYAKQADQLLRALGERVRSADVGVCTESCS
ncbi:MAG TPA: hypothetical protein VGN01_20565 [Acidobacteriaceae bacterium]|jgi:hypothetical protein